MKLRLLIVLLVLTVFASCRETWENGDEIPEINFSTHLVDLAETKGTMTNSAADLATAGGFNVWAMGHSGSWAATATEEKTSVMNGLDVISPDGGKTWSYGYEIMWPMDRYVSFFAYGPTASATVTTADTDGTPKINFTVSSTVSDQTDLLIATSVKNQAGAWYSYGKPVNLVFKHALSRISFSGMLTGSNSTPRIVKVKKIVMNGLYNKGTALLTTPVEWSTPTGDADASYTLNISDGMTTVRELADTPMTTDGVLLTTSGSYLFLMPQTLARPSDDPTMDVTLSISEDNGVSYHDFEYSSVVFSPNKWEPGKSYNYQIILDGNELRIIHIDSDMTLGDWSPSIVLQTVALTSADYDPALAIQVDSANLHFAINTLKTINDNSTTHIYRYYGVYGVNDLGHDIEIDLSNLNWTKKVTTQYPEQYLLFDFKKLIRDWNTNEEDSDRHWEFKISGYEDDWELERVVQYFKPDDYNIDIDKAGLRDKLDVDGFTSATLPAEYPTNSDGTVTVDIQNPLKYKGSIILKKK